MSPYAWSAIQSPPTPRTPAATSRDVQTQHHSCIPTVTLRLSHCWYPHTPPGMTYTPQLIQTEVREAGGAVEGWGVGGYSTREWKGAAEARQRWRGREQWWNCPQLAGAVGGWGPYHLTVNWTMTVELSLNDTAHRGWRQRRESEGSRAVGCGYTDAPSCTLACIYTTQPASGSHLIAALASCCSPRQLSGQSTESSRCVSTMALKEQFTPKMKMLSLSTPMLMEKQVRFHRPQNISGASHQDRVAAFS